MNELVKKLQNKEFSYGFDINGFEFNVIELFQGNTFKQVVYVKKGERFSQAAVAKINDDKITIEACDRKRFTTQVNVLFTDIQEASQELLFETLENIANTKKWLLK